MSRELTEILGITLQSEFVDPALYNTIRNIQFLLNFTYKLGRDFSVVEIPVKDGFSYRLSNLKLGIHGFVGRDQENGRIRYIIKDKGREKRALMEGFALNAETYKKVGILGICTMSDIILFLGGQKGWSVQKYV